MPREKEENMKFPSLLGFAPSKCQCIDFTYRSFPTDWLSVAYPKHCSQDEGLAGALLPLNTAHPLWETLRGVERPVTSMVHPQLTQE